MFAIIPDIIVAKSPELTSINSGRFSIIQLLLTARVVEALFVGFPHLSSAFIFSANGSQRVIVEGITATQVSGAPGTIEMAGCSGKVWKL